MKVWYFPIESYTERYTAQLVNWTESAFRRQNIDFVTIHGANLDTTKQITNAGPLDFKKRSYFSTSQIAAFFADCSMLESGDAIYLDDMFTPGIEALAYFIDMAKLNVKIYTRNHAGSCDIYDYVYKSKRWMRHYEKMVSAAVDTIFCASTIHKELMDVQGIDNVSVVGLPFDQIEVGSYHPHVPWEKRDKRILFASRCDTEKNPMFFVDLARKAKSIPSLSDYEFAIATGKKELQSNDPKLTEEIAKAHMQGIVKVHVGLSKADYYKLVATSKVQFNCASQDFISYTLLEASTYGTPSVVPAFRSFPEVMEKQPAYQMYRPWHVDDAIDSILQTITATYNFGMISEPARYNHGCLSRIAKAMKGESV